MNDFIVSYTPPNGTVLDPLAGTLTAAMAGLVCGLKVVVIEKDEECFNLSIERLHNFWKCQNSEEEVIYPSPKRQRRSIRIFYNENFQVQYEGSEANDTNDYTPVSKSKTTDSFESLERTPST